MSPEENVINYLKKIGLEHHYALITKQLKLVAGGDGVSPIEEWDILEINIYDESKISIIVHFVMDSTLQITLHDCERSQKSDYRIGDYIVLKKGVFFKGMPEKKQNIYKDREFVPLEIVGMNYICHLEDQEPEDSPIHYILDSPLLENYWYTNESFRSATNEERKRAEFQKMFSAK